MASSFRTIEIDLALPEYSSVSAASATLEDTIKESDWDRSIVVLNNIQSIEDSMFLPLIDRWINRFPGRLFRMNSDASKSALTLDIQNRLPIFDNKSVYAGQIVIADRVGVCIRVSQGCRPNRIPQSEFLIPIGRIDSCDKIPVTTNAKLKCYIDGGDLFDLNRLVLVCSGSRDSQIFWLKDSTTLVPVQSMATVNELFKEASGIAEKGTYIRGLASNRALVEKTVGKALFSSVMTKKQLSVINTTTLIDDRVVSFFQDPKRFLNGNKKIPVEVGGDTGHTFEHNFVNRRIKKRSSQIEICEMLKKAVEDGASFEDMMYNGRRQRRLIGTAFTSHRWPAVSREDVFDSPLLSEVVNL